MSIKQGSRIIAGTGGAVDIDNKSITKNTSDELQAIGVINMRSQNSAAIKFWTGTRQQYNAIVTKNANTLYNITDDTDVTLTLLEVLYPVGSVYITTANTCPLSALISGSTWELVSSGRVLQGADNDHAAGTTIEAGLPNITSGEWNSECVWPTATGGGAVVLGTNNLSSPDRAVPTRGTATGYAYYSFDASQSNSIYGNSTTVQPPAYVVNIYRRTA